jgi:hypothetical protein
MNLGNPFIHYFRKIIERSLGIYIQISESSPLKDLPSYGRSGGGITDPQVVRAGTDLWKQE